MKQVTAEQLKAQLTRDLLTCRCGCPQLDHEHTLREGLVVGVWGKCLNCPRCLAFRSLISAREKADLDKEIDRRLASSQLAAALRDQPLPAVPNRTPQFPSKPKRRVRGKGQARSASNAGVAQIYHDPPIKGPRGKYYWEEPCKK